jgi:hypothetical protein
LEDSTAKPSQLDVLQPVARHEITGYLSSVGATASTLTFHIWKSLAFSDHSSRSSLLSARMRRQALAPGGWL